MLLKRPKKLSENCPNPLFFSGIRGVEWRSRIVSKLLSFGVLLGLVLPTQPVGLRAASKVESPDQALLREAKIGSDGASLLVFLKKQTGKDPDRAQLEQFIKDLDN